MKGAYTAYYLQVEVFLQLEILIVSHFEFMVLQSKLKFEKNRSLPVTFPQLKCLGGLRVEHGFTSCLHILKFW